MSNEQDTEKIESIVQQSPISIPPQPADAANNNVDRILKEAEEKINHDDPGVSEDVPEIGETLSDDKEKKEESPKLTEDSIQGLYESAFAILSLRLGEHWQISKTEMAPLVKNTKLVLDKYSLKVSPEAALILSLGMILTPRVTMSIMISQQKKKDAASAN